MHPVDTLGRPIRDLRISVTDRCNFRCAYCMPKTVFGQDYRFMDRKELLTFEELERVARVFAGLGVEKIRLTGGEPLLRKELESLVERSDLVICITDVNSHSAVLGARRHARTLGRRCLLVRRLGLSRFRALLADLRGDSAQAAASP